MYLLNGGGLFPHLNLMNMTLLMKMDNMLLRDLLLPQIITEAVNHFGGEQLGKIILSDIDTRVKQVMKWKYSIIFY